eukprot:scaffold587_cov339-Pavlova_lutheri.AAC.75
MRAARKSGHSIIATPTPYDPDAKDAFLALVHPISWKGIEKGADRDPGHVDWTPGRPLCPWASSPSPEDGVGSAWGGSLVARPREALEGGTSGHHLGGGRRDRGCQARRLRAHSSSCATRAPRRSCMDAWRWTKKPCGSSRGRCRSNGCGCRCVEHVASSCRSDSKTSKQR